MEKVYIGKIVSTHGIKGEIRILSNFPFKEKVFKKGNNLIIDDKNYIINSYRVHKNYDMVTFENYNNINDILFLMKKDVYCEKNAIKLNDDEVLDEELIKYKVITTSNEIGYIKEIFEASKTNKILRIMLNREILVPLSSPMIKKIDKTKEEIIIELIDGM